jgi:Borrelia membrane protein P13
MKMKLIQIVLIIGIFSLFPLFSESNEEENYDQINLLIEEDLFSNFHEIYTHSFVTNKIDRENLYRENEINKIDTAKAVLWNLFVPFGVGSFIQGDYKGGFVILTVDVLSLGLMTSSFLFLTGTIDIEPWIEATFITGMAGLIIYGLNLYVNKIFRPIIYSNKYNDKLKQALRIFDTTSISIKPNIQITSKGDIAPMLNFKLSY